MKTNNHKSFHTEGLGFSVENMDPTANPAQDFYRFSLAVKSFVVDGTQVVADIVAQGPGMSTAAQAGMCSGLLPGRWPAGGAKPHRAQ